MSSVTLDADAGAAALVRSACSSDLRTARALLAAEPQLAHHDLATACVTGGAAEVARRIAREPELVDAPLHPSGWAPLTYACFSRFLRADPARGPGIVETARILLEAGADPNKGYLEGDYLELPLFAAAGIANDAQLTRLLLDAGADPNETLTDPRNIGESLYHAIEFEDLTCARLLLEAGTDEHRVTFCLLRALDFPDPQRAELLLRFGARPRRRALHTAVFRGRPARTVAALLDAGAPVDAPNKDGLTPLQVATRWGNRELADLLGTRGADPSAITDLDRRLGALVLSGERSGPDLSVPAAFLDWAALAGDAPLVLRLLEGGAAIDGPPGVEHPPLAQAAWRGHADTVEVFLTRDASLTWGDGGSAIGATLHGSLHCQHPEAGETMQTIDEISTDRYARVLRILMAADAPVPDALWTSELDLPAAFERLGVPVPSRGR